LLNKVNAFIIGAPKSGTTTLFDLLVQHPDVYQSNTKEPKFFTHEKQSFQGPGDLSEYKQALKSLEAYNSNFNFKFKVNIDASADYLYFSNLVAKDIYKYNPDSKIIVCLREPVSRAYSAYVHMRRDLREDKDIVQAINEYELGTRNNWEFMWDYIGCSLYHKNVESYKELFEKNIMLIDFSELISEPENISLKVFDFLGLDAYNVDELHSNEGGVPRKVTLLYRFLKYNGPIRFYFRRLLLKIGLLKFAQKRSRSIQSGLLVKHNLTDDESRFIEDKLDKEIHFYNSLFK
jgi:hypothetical protein